MLTSKNDIDFNIISPLFLVSLYQQYCDNKSSVSADIQAMFEEMTPEINALCKEVAGPSWIVHHKATHNNIDVQPASPAHSSSSTPPHVENVVLNLQTQRLINAFRSKGHLHAQLDPLSLCQTIALPELRFQTYGLTENDFDQLVHTHGLFKEQTTKLAHVYQKLQQTYCKHIGCEFMHIYSHEQKEWIQNYIENQPLEGFFNDKEKTKIFQKVHEAEMFEHFLQKKYPGAKRFGLEGSESAIVALHQIIERSVTKHHANNVIIGMSHRGRLNILHHLIKKPLQVIFKEFSGQSLLPEKEYGSGDVKYHLGTSTEVTYQGRAVYLSLCPNPSHLEAINTVVLGKVCAKQKQTSEPQKIYGIILHGDAAFAGQGIVAETLLLSKLKGYHVGGSLHVIINNQIGFTTDPVDSRSSTYCSDMGKMIQAPVIHVNGDNPEAVSFAAQFAIDYRYRFHCDVILDIVCYRRYGHNEMDEPTFTQPQMYATIRKHTSTSTQYKNKLINEGVLTKEGVKEYTEKINGKLQEAYGLSKEITSVSPNWLKGRWQGYDAHALDDQGNTGVSLDILQKIGSVLTTVPANFGLHPKVARLLQDKKKMFDSGKGVDWTTAEALAYGALLLEGKNIRLSGQDVARGTFSQRHVRFVDQKNGILYHPLAHINPKQGMFDVINSPLSEAGVLGFEYGYSTTDPESLVLWEAQFGDFANGAQVLIDQFISCSEAKWLRLSGLVLLLPHGYEGQGAEHSSARLERYLQLCAKDNMIVANCTTPANYFHILRRQLCRQVRKPLILMTPKSLLRHKQAVSMLSDMGPQTTFSPVITEQNRNVVSASKIKRIILCSGKIYYDLEAKRTEMKIKDILLMRVEEVYPFPKDKLQSVISKYKHAQIVWCQEEPMNMGAWSFIAPQLEIILSAINHCYKRAAFIGRIAASAPATGFSAQHALEQESLVNKALTV